MKIPSAKTIIAALGIGSILVGAFYGTYRMGGQHGVNVTRTCIKKLCDEETFNKVDKALMG